MCLVALAIDQSRRFPLVLAANRDEFFARPAQRLGWWSPGAGAPDILGGRDLHAGGTWLGLTAAGRLALVTNVREPQRNDPQAPSRGEIVPLWLRGDISADRFWTRVALSGYNGFNVIAADFQTGHCFWAANRSQHPVRLERGLYGLANATLDTPWPKVQALKQRLHAALSGPEAADCAEAMATRMFAALADPNLARHDELPATGVSLEWERLLSAAFIRASERGYGTRCSTVIVTERVNKRLVTHVLERSFGPGTSLALLRRSTLRDWPPRYELPATTPVIQAEVTDTALDPRALVRQVRRRSLLPPSRAGL